LIKGANSSVSGFSLSMPLLTAINQQLAKLLYDNQKEFCRLMYKNLGFEGELEFSEDYSDILAWLNTSEKAEKALEAKRDGSTSM